MRTNKKQGKRKRLEHENIVLFDDFLCKKESLKGNNSISPFIVSTLTQKSQPYHLHPTLRTRREWEGEEWDADSFTICDSTPLPPDCIDEDVDKITKSWSPKIRTQSFTVGRMFDFYKEVTSHFENSNLSFAFILTPAGQFYSARKCQSRPFLECKRLLINYWRYVKILSKIKKYKME